ncbi:fluoride efflux transporter CrcB [Parafannyhessea umbonata]|uniref:Fluoride-specific ion channel FluC n=1 Tax=Parafannyhessea umbonata TaxID=604330 RepID=A0A1H9R4A2_9ACTN|nr:fluoride efflux transporter CrcB [Parafannyhessea umbonata]SER67554.1 CrcB protein [Parafannyhessea umbonata]
MLTDCIFVGIGGFAGSVLRYLCGQAFPQGDFPLTTMGINVLGSFVLGTLAALVTRGMVTDDHLSLLLRVGLCGGFTTFSTLSLEAAGMMGEGRTVAGLAYVAGSCVLGVVAAMIGGSVASA